MRNKRTALTAGAAGLLAAGVLGVLQILEQAIGAWHPKPEVSGLIVVAVFFAGLVVAGLRSRRVASAAFNARCTQLRDLLGVWPAPLLRDADPIRLGVFPTSRQIDTSAPYIPRDTDESLRAAMLPGAVVLVCGEPRAGASRTAFEAARSSLGDAVVVAPRSASSLRELTLLDPPLQLGGRHVLVWLDGLDRYVEALDAECLTALSAVGGRVTVLATIRLELWDEWLQATGAEGEAARALAAQARAFQLSASLSRGEVDVARELYPGKDFSAGIGLAVGSRGRDSAPPGSPHTEHGEHGESDPSGPWWRDRQLLGPVLATCVTLAALALVLVLSGFKTPSINDQVAADEREGSQHNRHPAFVMKAELHGTGIKSWLVLFRDDPGTPKPRSDELRIYDEHGDKLVRALRFEPAGKRAVFQERAIADIDFDGAEEIVGGYAYANESDGGGAMVPFAIDWNRSRGRYDIVSLDQHPPTLSPQAIKKAEEQYLSGNEGPPKFSPKAIKTSEKQYRRVYAAPATFSDPVDHLRLMGHRVQDLAVSSIPRRVVAGWYLRPLLDSHRAVFELHVAIFDSSTGAPHLTRCTLTGLSAPLLARLGKDRAPYKVFEETYDRASRGRGCLPQYGEG